MFLKVLAARRWGCSGCVQVVGDKQGRIPELLGFILPSTPRGLFEPDLKPLSSVLIPNPIQIRALAGIPELCEIKTQHPEQYGRQQPSV